MMNQIRVRMLAVMLISGLAGAASAQTTWYVDDDADPNGDGMTWSTAFSDLQDALDVATYDDEIRVAGGVYVPSQPTDPNDPRTATFELISSVGMYGGYAGLANANHPDDRDIELYETILSGDLAGDDGPGFENDDENTYHVVRANECDEAAVLDGFTITAGNANSTDYPDDRGGGVSLRHSDLSISNCLITQNSAEEGGGGIRAMHGSPSFIDCLVRDNRVTDWSGGGVNAYSGLPLFRNCTIAGNVAAEDGGGVSGQVTDPIFVNCQITGNSAAEDGGGIGLAGWCEPTLVNCVIS